MEDYELTLFDRLNMIRDTIDKYGEDKFYLSFKGKIRNREIRYTRRSD